MVRKLNLRMSSSGKITLPAVPGMLDDYVERCMQIFACVGRAFSESERENLRRAIAGQLDKAYAESHRSSIVISYETTASQALSYLISTYSESIEQVYDNWLTREPPLFGAHPDALICSIADRLGDPQASRILDIGAGTGRNALALARRGHLVDAVELNGKFAAIMSSAASAEHLPVNVIESDLLSVKPRLRRDYAMALFSEVAPDLRGMEQLRNLVELASDCLRPGGYLVFNTFLTRPHYSPDEAARQFAQQVYSAFFTAVELSQAISGLPLELVVNENTHDYEEANLPAGAWPQTSWYANWVSGRDVFDLPREECPIECRWLAYRKIS